MGGEPVIRELGQIIGPFVVGLMVIEVINVVFDAVGRS